MCEDNEIPSTDDIEELARFWETHDATDFEDEVEEEAEPVFVRKTERHDRSLGAQRQQK